MKRSSTYYFKNHNCSLGLLIKVKHAKSHLNENQLVIICDRPGPGTVTAK